jgi:hypothetical protein
MVVAGLADHDNVYNYDRARNLGGQMAQYNKIQLPLCSYSQFPPVSTRSQYAIIHCRFHVHVLTITLDSSSFVGHASPWLNKDMPTFCALVHKASFLSFFKAILWG